jgi:predicted nucleic acid-binding protein
MRVFFDASAFAKRYVEESGTEQVLQWCDRATELALSVVVLPELISAFCRLRREGKITRRQYTALKEQLLQDIVDALVVDTTPQVLSQAVRALESHTLRGMDAIHVGAAVECGAQAFITADRQQASAARAMGLEVVQV